MKDKLAPCDNPDCNATFKLLMQSNEMLAYENYGLIEDKERLRQDVEDLRAEVKVLKGKLANETFMRGSLNRLYDEQSDSWTALNAEVEKLTAQLDVMIGEDEFHAARCEKLERALREIELHSDDCSCCREKCFIARSALAGKEGGGNG